MSDTITLRHTIAKDKTGVKFYQVSHCTIGNLAFAWGSYGPVNVLNKASNGEPSYQLSSQARVWFPSASRPFHVTSDAKAATARSLQMRDDIISRKKKSSSKYQFDTAEATGYMEQITPRDLLDFLRTHAQMDDAANSELLAAIANFGLSPSPDQAQPTEARPEPVKQNDTALKNKLWGTW